MTGPTGPGLNLVCLPYAGGVAAGYRRWQRGLGGRIEVVPIDYPGRGSRAGERAIVDSAAIVADIAARVADLGAANTVLFGHSMGGWVAFEVAHRLEQAGQRPAGLIVSGAPAPAYLAKRPIKGALTDAQLREMVLDWGGTPAELLDDPAIVGPLYAHLRADLATIDSLVPSVDVKIEAPMTAYAGRADTTAPSREVAGWARNAQDWRGISVVPGGHFFTTSSEDVVLRLIKQHCAALTPAFGPVAAFGN